MKDNSVISKMIEQAKQQKEDNNANHENRLKFKDLVERYYSERLRLEPGKNALSRLGNKNTILLEASHGAQLGHLGIYRLFVKGGDIARKMKNGLMLFFVGDQYSADMYPEINKIRIPMVGKVREKTLLISVENKHKPARLTQPPTEKVIMGIRNKIMGSFGANLNHFLVMHGIQKHVIDKTRFKESLDEVIGIMVDSAKSVDSYADWCTRIQLILLKRTNPELYYNYVLFYPIWDIMNFKPEWSKLMGMQKDINEYENNMAEGGTFTDLDKSRLWYYCSCGARARGSVKDDGRCDCRCEVCGSRFETECDSKNSSPEIVFSQILTPLFLGITGRVVGHVHAYAKVADGFLREKLKQAPPQRFVISSYPIFHGIGDPKEGDTRCSLIRAAIEAEFPEIGRSLTCDWEENPQIYSYFDPKFWKVAK